MPQLLDSIPLFQEIVTKQGTISLYFRLLWDKLRTLSQLAPTLATYDSGTRTAAIAATIATVTAAGLDRIAVYGRVLVPDGVASAWQATVTWTDGSGQTHVGANVTGDTTTSLDTFVIEVACDAATVINLTTTYASTTPAKMQYRVRATVEQLAA